MSVAALIVAAGAGKRAGGSVPKQYAQLGNKALFLHSVDAFLANPEVHSVFVVIGAGQEGMAAEALRGRQVAGLLIGGAERQDSVRAGLEALAGRGVTKVLIHDAARPFLSSRIISRLVAALDAAHGALPALPVVDTLARGGELLGDVVDRSGLVRVQTPQAFRFDAIMTSHRQWNLGIASDDAQMARASGFDIVIIDGDPALEKITLESDLQAAEQRLDAARSIRTGMGFDVHRLEAGKPLWLCGIEIPHPRGLSGHSDADVAIHALVDALLGALGDGDIGSHFPPSDARWKGAPSHLFLAHARERVDSRGGSIEHVDLTIICEAPRIGPHREAMRARLAELLGVDMERVSVKATTTEGLGLTGRGEGIAAQAVATLRI